MLAKILRKAQSISKCQSAGGRSDCRPPVPPAFEQSRQGSLSGRFRGHYSLTPTRIAEIVLQDIAGRGQHAMDDKARLGKVAVNDNRHEDEMAIRHAAARCRITQSTNNRQEDTKNRGSQVIVISK